MMHRMSDLMRPTTTSGTICAISITEITKMTLPAGPEGRD
jgi:hypothetical protein